MSTSKKSRNYLRFNQQSIQGKFILLLSIIASAVGVLLAVNYGIIEREQQQQLQMLNVWLPTSDNLNKLDIYIQTGNVKNHQVLNCVSALNTLSNQWQNERMLINYERFLEQLEALQLAVSEEEVNFDNNHENTAVQKTLSILLFEATKHVEQIANENKHFTGYLKSLFIWEYLIYVITGFALSTIMVLTVMNKIRRLKFHISKISNGNFSENIPTQKDEFYSITKSLNLLIDNLKNITHFAGEVGRGNMDAAMNAFDSNSALGRSLSEMRDGLKRVASEEKNRQWINEGIAKFAEILRQHNSNVPELSNAVVGELVKYVGALQGAIFVTHQENGITQLQMSGCYAYDRQKYLHKKIPVDSGLIGQAYLEKAPKYLLEIPKNYDTITTGLGQGSPESVLMLPLLHEDRVEGVLEVASLRKFHEHELEFLNKITQSLGAAVAGVRISEETSRLLEESQSVAEELRSQEEEMRQNMEEMQATQEEMIRAQQQLAIKEANLYAFVHNSADSIITITRDYRVGLINKAQKARYHGTQFENIDEGSDILPALGSVADEWKGYYDRAFRGESLKFTLKSTVKGENYFREYEINPIKARTGEVVAVSCISRDITDKSNKEFRIKQHEGVLKLVVDLNAKAYMALDNNFKVFSFSKNIPVLLNNLSSQIRTGDNLLQLLDNESIEFWKEHITKAYAGEKGSFSNMASNGETVDLKIHPVKDEDQQVLAVLISIHTV